MDAEDVKIEEEINRIFVNVLMGEKPSQKVYLSICRRCKNLNSSFSPI